MSRDLRDRDIHISTVLPASIDTPFFQHAADYTGRALKPLNPVHDADMVAKAIASLAKRPQRERVAGGVGRAMRQTRMMSPGTFERRAARMVDADHFRDEPAASMSGTVKEPMPEWTSVSGGCASSPGPLRRAALPLAFTAATGIAVRRWLSR